VKRSLWGLGFLVAYAQGGGGWGSSLLEADTVWLGLPQTAGWLERQARRLNLREANSGLPYPKGLLTKGVGGRLIALYARESGLEWWWQVGEDTFVLHSRPVSVRQLRKHLVLLRGPCAAGPQEVELMAVFRPRAKDLSAEEAVWGWQPFLPERWEREIIAPIALLQRYSPTAVTAMGFVLRREGSRKPFRLIAVRLYGRRSAFLPRDEVVASYAHRRLPKGFIDTLWAVWAQAPPYGYVVRVNDYYPASVAEGVLWAGLIGTAPCVRPGEILAGEGKGLRTEWVARLSGEGQPRLRGVEVR
jgi:hypothetical protein